MAMFNANELWKQVTIDVKTDRLFGFRLLMLELLIRMIHLICKINVSVEHDFDKEI